MAIVTGEYVVFKYRNRTYNCIDRIYGNVIKVNRINLRIVEEPVSAYAGRIWNVPKIKVRRVSPG